MQRRVSRAILVTSLVLLLGSLATGAPPPNIITSANGNTAGGTGALTSNSTGIDSTAFGQSTLLSNTAGFRNTATSASALISNTTGFDNAAFGESALFSNTTGFGNTATGVEALRANTTGSRNTASGDKALFSNTTGVNNTALGRNALLRTTTGNSNLALGQGARATLTSGSNNIYLGHPGVATESNTLRLGNVQTRTFIAGVANTPVTGNTMRITSTGRLGVLLSSARYKQDIQPMSDQSQKVHQLRPVTFHYKAEPAGPRQYGLIAEEVAQVYPELVTRNAEGEIEGVRYEELTPMLLNELQRQHQQLATQHQQLDAQAQQLQAVSQQLAEFKAQNDSLRAAVEALQGQPTKTVAAVAAPGER